MTLTPLSLGPDVTVIRTLPTDDRVERVPNNTLVITGHEPVLVDCGPIADSADWWRQLETVVDPSDVRWVFLTHDDMDHIGNLGEVLLRCPDATVVSSWLIEQRLAASGVGTGGSGGGFGRIPPERSRWINDGEVLDAGGRRLIAVRPPVYDAPSTRGVFDVTSGTYWSVDCFGSAVPHHADEVADLDRDVWEEGFVAFQQQVSPWVTDVEPLRWRAAIGRLAALQPTVIASGHGPVIHRRDIERSLDLLAELPRRPLAGLPGQRQLEATLASPRAP